MHGITLTAEPSWRPAPAGQTPQAVHFLIEAAGASGVRPAVTLGLLLDRSGSMEGAKLTHLKAAVQAVVGSLTREDRLAVIAFDDEVEMLLPVGPLTDPQAALGKIQVLTPRGGTQIGQAMERAVAALTPEAKGGRPCRLVLLTDGKTWGDEAACEAAAASARAAGVPLVTLGLGEDWNEALLMRLADASGGDSHWLKEPEEMAPRFLEQVGGLKGTVARGLSLDLQLPMGVRARRVHRVKPMISEVPVPAASERALRVPLSDLEAGAPQGVLLEVELPARVAGAFAVGAVTLRYAALEGDGAPVRTDLTVDCTADPAAVRVVPAVMNVVERVSAFRLQTRALSEAEQGAVAAATRRLEAAATRLLTLGESGLAAVAREQAAQLAKTGTLSATGSKALRYGTRRLTGPLTASIATPEEGGKR
jgi:Ca-activated chloride channel family protein